VIGPEIESAEATLSVASDEATNPPLSGASGVAAQGAPEGR